jgi:hypothetical protein
MEPLWSPAVATGGNRSQMERQRQPGNQAKTVAVGCHRLLEMFHGKEGVDGSSPAEGLTGSRMVPAVARTAVGQRVGCPVLWKRFGNVASRPAAAVSSARAVVRQTTIRA